jgi:NADH dehydrogenase/putative oxidoreductase
MNPSLGTAALKHHAFKQRVLAPPIAGLVAAIRVAERSLWPVLDLVVRFWLAQTFFVSGVLKAADWSNALYLAANEYPVSWLDPVHAAWIGVTTELVGGVLFAFGLATRVAAFAMLLLALVIQFNYLAFDTHLFWVALFALYVVRGAGPISLDRLLARGLVESALPFGAAFLRAADALTRRLASPYLLALRVWLAIAMLAAAGSDIGGFMPAALFGKLFPVQTAEHLPLALVASAAWLLLVGLGTRAISLILIGAVIAMQTSEPHLSQDWYWLLTLAVLFVGGAGSISFDAAIVRALRRVFPQLDDKPAFALDGLPRVVVVGAGFGGLTCAAQLAKAPVKVTLIDRHNYHLFQPLLYQVATAGLSAGDIATPIRSLFRQRFNAEVLFGEVSGVDVRRQEVLVGARRVPYDYLVLATGASHSYFGRDEWGPYAPGLKRVEDATELRRRMLTAFELAETVDDETARRSLLTFLIVGGGPTGVELAGAIAELARHGMEKEFRNFDPASARVLLVQAAPRILPTFNAALSEKAQHALEVLGVEVMLNTRVERIDEHGVTVNGMRIASSTVMWAAGVVASPAAKWLGAEADNAGRIKVESDLSVPGRPNIYAIGDTALAMAWKGAPVPGLAPAAKQGGTYVARVIRARVEGRRAPGPFVYKHLGSLATIGRKAAVADFGKLRVWGAPAWWLWGAVHVGFLVGLRNRMSVMFDWFWAYLTYRAGTRLITGASPEVKQTETRVARVAA